MLILRIKISLGELRVEIKNYERGADFGSFVCRIDANF